MIALLLALLLGSSAQAQSAEHYRLQSEMVKLAQKSSWTGVERSYRAMVALKIPLDGSDHLLGAQASIADGDALEALYRLRRVTEVPLPDDATDAARATLEQARSAMELLTTRYGLVSISVAAGREPVMERPSAPFAPAERAAVQHAQERLAADREFRGLLPVGSYTVDGVPFEVGAKREWHSIVVAPGHPS